MTVQNLGAGHQNDALVAAAKGCLGIMWQFLEWGATDIDRAVNAVAKKGQELTMRWCLDELPVLIAPWLRPR